MRRLLFIPMLFLAGTAMAAEASLFEQANAKYQASDFKGAAAAYQKVAQTGRNTAAVNYNLGNAALKGGEKGQALVYYERALKAAPRDKDLLWNMQVLKGALKDKIEDNSFFVWAAFRGWVAMLTADELARGFAFFLALAALWGTLAFLFPAARVTIAWMRTLAFLGILFSGAFFGVKMVDTKDPLAVVLDKETYAYYGPSERETKAFLLHEGAEGRVEDLSGDWVYLSLPNNKSGWIRKNSCEIV